MDVTTFLHNFWVRKKGNNNNTRLCCFSKLKPKEATFFQTAVNLQLTTSSPGLFPLKMGEVGQLRDFKWSLRKGGR